MCSVGIDQDIYTYIMNGNAEWIIQLFSISESWCSAQSKSEAIAVRQNIDVNNTSGIPLAKPWRHSVWEEDWFADGLKEKGNQKIEVDFPLRRIGCVWEPN